MGTYVNCMYRCILNLQRAMHSSDQKDLIRLYEIRMYCYIYLFMLPISRKIEWLAEVLVKTTAWRDVSM